MKRALLFLALVVSLSVSAGNKIKVYFNHPVDVSVSTTTPAVYLNNCMADTLVAYINRAKYSIDISQYEYSQGSYANIATAVNNAYLRGVGVRWIYDGSGYNPSVSLLNPGIHALPSPTSADYNIMHNKIITIDANSTNPDEAVVITGSFDWTYAHFSYEYNNTVIFQDSALAHVYTQEFNMMWGSTGLVPDTTLSKFGPYKTDLGRHTFVIEGKTVEVYFSPSDYTESHIQNTISTANTDLYFGIYTFTSSGDASLIVNKKTNGVYVAGIIDQFSYGYSPYTQFTSGLGSNFICYSGSTIYHNKFLIVDQANKCSDPLVLTGSHNWTTSANTKNDENTVIIHDDTIANQYYQSFHNDFISNGGSLVIQHGCGEGVAALQGISTYLSIYPNPSLGGFSIGYFLNSEQYTKIEVYNMIGQKILDVANKLEPQGPTTHNFNITQAGTYQVRIENGGEVLYRQIVVL